MSKTKRLATIINGHITSWLDYVTVVSEVVSTALISTIVVAGGALILLANGQGQEVTVHIGGRGLGANLFYFLSLTYWAAQAWFWARLVLTITYGNRRGSVPFERFVVSQVPRILGTAAFLITAYAFYQAHSPGLAAASLVAGTVFYAAVIFRRAIMGMRRPDPSADLLGFKGASKDFGLLLPIMIALSAAVIVAGSILALTSPVRAGILLGAGPVTFLALGSIIPLGTALHIFAMRRRFPLIAILIILLALFSLNNDNHLVRQKTDEPLRVSPEAEFRRWADRLPDTAGESGHPFVIVTTAGGGLRAAYWTTTILGAVEDHVPHFSDHVFAISGVSGGSLGATIFTSLLAERDVITCEEVRPPAATCFEQAGQDVLSRDFLGPTMMSFLYADFMQRFLPAAVLPDRAEALERAWETSWDDHGPEGVEGRLGGGFTALWRDARTHGDWLPALLLNGTLREDGKRVITSHLRIGRNIFPSTYDFFELHCGPLKNKVRPRRDVPVSSAIMNSTRFPYLTPAGTMRACHQAAINHILDGGYFENFGAVTAVDILNWAVAEAGRREVPIRPIVLQIVSDPESPLSQDTAPFQLVSQDDETATSVIPPVGNTFLSELLSPIQGMLKTRSARGVLAAVHLERRIRELKSEPPSPFIGEPLYVRLELETVGDIPPPSLGWVLSDTSRELIRDELVCILANRRNLLRLLSAFGAEDAAATGRLAEKDCPGGDGAD